MISNKRMLEIAGEVFEKYDLPDGARVTAWLGYVDISYVFGEGEGVPEMRQLIREIDPHVKASGRFVSFETPLEGFPEEVIIRAQMSVEPPRVEVPKSDLEAALEAVLGE